MLIKTDDLKVIQYFLDKVDAAIYPNITQVVMEYLKRVCKKEKISVDNKKTLFNFDRLTVE